MQDVDCPAHVQALSQPAGFRRPRVQDEPLGLVARSEDLHGVVGHLWRLRDLGQESPVRAAEAKLTVGLPIDLEALLVDGAVVSATEQREVGERRGTSLSPVPDVMALAEAHSAAREAAPAVSMVERPPERGGNRARPGADLQ